MKTKSSAKPDIFLTPKDARLQICDRAFLLGNGRPGGAEEVFEGVIKCSAAVGQQTALSIAHCVWLVPDGEFYLNHIETVP
jgi:hypothetical protein